MLSLVLPSGFCTIVLWFIKADYFEVILTKHDGVLVMTEIETLPTSAVSLLDPSVSSTLNAGKWIPEQIATHITAYLQLSMSFY